MTKKEYKYYLIARKEENEELLQYLNELSSSPSVASEVILSTLFTSLALDNIMKELYYLEGGE